MDTDDLSDNAYEIIVHAAKVCDTLKTELGVLSYDCENEDIWLEKVQARLNEITKDPVAFVEYWNLEEEEGIDAGQMKRIVQKLSRRVDAIKCQ